MRETERKKLEDKSELCFSNHSGDFFQETPENSFRKVRERAEDEPPRVGVFRRVTMFKPRDNIELDFFCPQSE